MTACPKTSCSATYSGGAVHLTSKLYPKGLSLPFEDHLDKLEVKEGSPPLFGAAPAMESRQCLCLHVGRVFAPDPSQAVALAQDLRGELSEAQGYLGDAAPMISEAEAFVRHNAHDCLAPHHEKDYRVLQLFAPSFMSGRVLVVLRVSSLRAPLTWTFCGGLARLQLGHGGYPQGPQPSRCRERASLSSWSSFDLWARWFATSKPRDGPPSWKVARASARLWSLSSTHVKSLSPTADAMSSRRRSGLHYRSA